MPQILGGRGWGRNGVAEIVRPEWPSNERNGADRRGCAIECRINAEDPANNFQPSPGAITKWQPPGGPGVRLDTHVCQGYRVPPNYDSLVAKLLVYQPTREEAIKVMNRALKEFVVEGIKTTIPIHQKIFSTSAFIEGNVDTTFIERNLMSGGDHR